MVWKNFGGLCPILSQYIYNSISIERNNKSIDLTRQRGHMQGSGLVGTGWSQLKIVITQMPLYIPKIEIINKV